jgi:omega-amidase
MKVTGIQMNPIWEQPGSNQDVVWPLLEAAARSGARLAVLPEMWATGFSMRPDLLAEYEGGESETFMRTAAVRLHMAVLGSIPSKSPEWSRPRNVVVVALPDGSVHRYSKIHTFTYGGESEHYEPGDRALTVSIDGVRVTPLICYDLRFPEVFAALADRTDLFVVVANWPRPRADHWRALLVARAIETQAFVMGVNRHGDGGGLDYRGDSMIVSPFGDVVASAPSNADHLLHGDVNPIEVDHVRTTFRFLADRRPDLYPGL